MYYLQLDPLLIIIAVVPALYLMVRVYKADRIEKEPLGYLVMLAVWGIVSTAVAVGLETVGQYLIQPLGQGTLAYNIIVWSCLG